MKHIRHKHLPFKGGRIGHHHRAITQHHHHKHTNLQTLKESLGLLNIKHHTHKPHHHNKKKIHFKL